MVLPGDVVVPADQWWAVWVWCCQHLPLSSFLLADYDYGKWNEFKVISFKNPEDIVMIKLRFNLPNYE